jgi:hypothetical protein
MKDADTSSAGFLYLHRMFPNLSDAKIKHEISVGPQIRKG